MLDLTVQDAAESSFVKELGLVQDGSPSRYRLSSIFLKDIFCVQLKEGKGGKVQSVEVEVPSDVVGHPVLGPILNRLLKTLVESCGDSPGTEQWPVVTSEARQIHFEEHSLSIDSENDNVSFSLSRKRKGFWSFITS